MNRQKKQAPATITDPSVTWTALTAPQQAALAGELARLLCQVVLAQPQRMPTQERRDERPGQDQ